MRAPAHIVASYAWQAWYYSRRGSQQPARFDTALIWETESRKFAPVRQVHQGCIAVRKGRFRDGYTPVDLGWWRADTDELASLIVRRIMPQVTNKPKETPAVFTCGVSINCGTVRGYNVGGRCEWCKRAKHANRWTCRNMVCGEDPRCGTRAGYQAGGRCPDCRAEQAAYSRDRYSVREPFRCAIPGLKGYTPDIRCGTSQGYASGGRCDDCREAHRIQNRKYRKKRNVEEKTCQPALG